MKRRRFSAFLAVVLLAISLWWLLRGRQPGPELAKTQPPAAEEPATSPTTTASPKSNEERRKEAVDMVVSMLGSPISFYGKVVDQNGDPVADAKVGYSALDKFMAPGTGYTGTSDANGSFSISGIKGTRLSVNVRKVGYYFIDGKSNAAFSYGGGSDGYFREPPTKDNPAIFVLHKMGRTEPLVYVGTKRYKPSKDGQPVDVNLATGKVVAPGQGDIRFERWANDQAKNQRGHFDWRLRITVPGGGLVERKSKFDFEAPEGGYKESVEINMPASLGDQWSYTVNMSYFVRLRDGRYARFDAMVQAGHESSALVIDAFLNPKPGSRNLEYDPKQAAVTQ